MIDVDQLVEMLDNLKVEGRIVDYRLNGNDVTIMPVVPIDHIDIEIVLSENTHNA